MTPNQNEEDIHSVVIVGGGTAGWMVAAGLCSVLASRNFDITLIESEAIGTVGVGEATLPGIRFFNQKLGIDENALMAATQATYKLGIEFVDWGKIGDSYIHPFGNYGFEINRTAFHHYVTRAISSGLDINMDHLSLPVMASRSNKFQYPSEDMASILSTFGYAYQFDAGLYAKFLREFCEKRGVKRLEGRVAYVTQNSDSGFIETVKLDDKRVVSGDFFVDCSGFRSLLMGQTLGVEYEDWTKYLPCNRAVTVGSEVLSPLRPYTRATAKSAGWQWQIPLQHRTGNGFVYSSEFMSDEEAEKELLRTITGKTNSPPKRLKFKTGRRVKNWEKNCVSVGLSGGFLEPLESTGIFLIQEAITNFIENFPAKSEFKAQQEEYNRVMNLHFERVRDFLILHYIATTREDSPFWRYCRHMSLPDSLRHKLELFKERGHIVNYATGAFKPASWIAVYYGQGIIPQSYHPMAEHMPDDILPSQIKKIEEQIAMAVQLMSTHEGHISKYCRAH